MLVVRRALQKRRYIGKAFHSVFWLSNYLTVGSGWRRTLCNAQLSTIAELLLLLMRLLSSTRWKQNQLRKDSDDERERVTKQNPNHLHRSLSLTCLCFFRYYILYSNACTYLLNTTYHVTFVILMQYFAHAKSLLPRNFCQVLLHIDLKVNQSFADLFKILLKSI